jgi:hypothetical protein
VDSRYLAEMALEHCDSSDASAVILELGRSAAWDAPLIRRAMHDVLRLRVSPRSQRALRLLFFTYEQAQRHRELSVC